MLVEAELVCPQTVAVQYLLVPPPAIEADIFDVSSMATATPIQSPVFGCSELAGSVEFSRSESVCIEVVPVFPICFSSWCLDLN